MTLTDKLPVLPAVACRNRFTCKSEVELDRVKTRPRKRNRPRHTMPSRWPLPPAVVTTALLTLAVFFLHSAASARALPQRPRARNQAVVQITYGFTGDACRSNSSCIYPRECVDAATQAPCAKTATGSCRCRPRRPHTCVRSADCDLGERCTRSVAGGSNGGECTSCQLVRRALNSFGVPFVLLDDDGGNCGVTMVAPAVDSCFFGGNGASFSGATGEGCNDVDKIDRCRQGRLCMTENGTHACPFLGDVACVCREPHLDMEECHTSEDCSPGDRCAIMSADDGSEDDDSPDSTCISCVAIEIFKHLRPLDLGNCGPLPVCREHNHSMTAMTEPTFSGSPPPSPTATPSPSMSASPPPSASASPSVTPTRDLPSSDTAPRRASHCIGAHHLAHYAANELVYTRARAATVLCDAHGSCATPGHIVLFHGQAMLMRRYCERVGCRERLMAVNSPRMRRGLRLASPSPGLQFSALAAAFGSAPEEAVLRALLHLGV